MITDFKTNDQVNGMRSMLKLVELHDQGSQRSGARFARPPEKGVPPTTTAAIASNSALTPTLLGSPMRASPSTSSQPSKQRRHINDVFHTFGTDARKPCGFLVTADCNEMTSEKRRADTEEGSRNDDSAITT